MCFVGGVCVLLMGMILFGGAMCCFVLVGMIDLFLENIKVLPIIVAIIALHKCKNLNNYNGNTCLT